MIVTVLIEQYHVPCRAAGLWSAGGTPRSLMQCPTASKACDPQGSLVCSSPAAGHRQAGGDRLLIEPSIFLLQHCLIKPEISDRGGGSHSFLGGGTGGNVLPIPQQILFHLCGMSGRRLMPLGHNLGMITPC